MDDFLVADLLLKAGIYCVRYPYDGYYDVYDERECIGYFKDGKGNNQRIQFIIDFNLRQHKIKEL